jgi:hypothetical protein
MGHALGILFVLATFRLFVFNSAVEEAAGTGGGITDCSLPIPSFFDKCCDRKNGKKK